MDLTPCEPASISLSQISSASIFPDIVRWCWPGLRAGLQTISSKPPGARHSPSAAGPSR